MSQSPDPPRTFNGPGFFGGLLGSVLSLGALGIAFYFGALAFGFEASSAGAGAVLSGGIAAAGVVSGSLAVRRSSQGRAATTPIIWSFACAVISAIGTAGSVRL